MKIKWLKRTICRYAIRLKTIHPRGRKVVPLERLSDDEFVLEIEKFDSKDVKE